MPHPLKLYAILFLSVAASVHADDWETYRSDEYGFSMQVPKGTQFTEKEWEHGWAGLHASYEGVDIYVITRQGTEASAEEIEKVGTRVSGIPENAWKKVDEGKNMNGWKWHRTYKAQKQDAVVLAGMGTGPKGSYLLFLKTTADDLEENETAYKKWYSSLKVF